MLELYKCILFVETVHGFELKEAFYSLIQRKNVMTLTVYIVIQSFKGCDQQRMVVEL